MKNNIITTRASSAQLIFLLLFGIAILHLPTLATAQSLVSNDVKLLVSVSAVKGS